MKNACLRDSIPKCRDGPFLLHIFEGWKKIDIHNHMVMTVHLDLLKKKEILLQIVSFLSSNSEINICCRRLQIRGIYS